MAENVCGYSGDRREVLVSYLYDDIDPVERASFSAHLTACEPCRAELDGMRGVQAQLGTWAPPEPAFAAGRQLSTIRHHGWWREIPAWAQVAAALLFLGVAAGLANLDIRYNHDGLTVRTGWLKPATSSGTLGFSRTPAAAPPVTTPASSATGADPWRADLVALEQRLRGAIHAESAQAARAVAAHAGAGANDADIVHRVRVLLAESERRQQNELALRLGTALVEVQSERTGDLARIKGDLTKMMKFVNRTDDNVLRARSEVEKNNSVVQENTRVVQLLLTQTK